MAPYRVGEVTDIVREGDEVQVKVINIDDQNKVRLSRKAVIMEAPDFDPKDYEGMGVPEGSGSRRPAGAGSRGGRGGDGRGRGGGRDRRPRGRR
jgi:polyribonucleotide nucleotidyltransferase